MNAVRGAGERWRKIGIPPLSPSLFLHLSLSPCPLLSL